MRSIGEILNLVVDGEVSTREQAMTVIEEEVQGRANLLTMTTNEARHNLLDAIGFATAYMSVEMADKVMFLYDTQHPLWGKSHPTPAEAMQLGEEAAAKRHMERDGDQKDNRKI